MNTLHTHHQSKSASLFWRERVTPIVFFMLMLVAWWVFLRYAPVDEGHGTTGALKGIGDKFQNTELLFLIDALITLPIACLLLIKDKKKALIKGVALASLALVAGNILLPADMQQWLPVIMDGRFIVLGVFVFLEVITILSVITLIRTEFAKGVDLDSAILRSVATFIPSGMLRQIMWFEGRMWSCLLMSKKLSTLPLKGDVHFSYWNKDGAHSNALGFIIIMAVELPIAHVLLHFMWSPFAANVVTGLSILGLLFFVAERNAMKLRPISLLFNEGNTPTLIIRYGLSNPIEIPINNILSVSPHCECVKRASHLKRFNYAGVPNVKIKLASSETRVTEYYVGVDDPQQLIKTLNSYQ